MVAREQNRIVPPDYHQTLLTKPARPHSRLAGFCVEHVRADRKRDARLGTTEAFRDRDDIDTGGDQL
jgi:hypothetical protein